MEHCTGLAEVTVSSVVIVVVGGGGGAVPVFVAVVIVIAIITIMIAIVIVIVIIIMFIPHRLRQNIRPGLYPLGAGYNKSPRVPGLSLRSFYRKSTFLSIFAVPSKDTKKRCCCYYYYYYYYYYY